MGAGVLESEIYCISGVRRQILNQLFCKTDQCSDCRFQVLKKNKIRESFWRSIKILMLQSCCGDYKLLYYLGIESFNSI